MLDRIYELTPLGIAASWAWRYRRNLREGLRRPVDWNAIRQQLGYEAVPDRPVHKSRKSLLERLRYFSPFAKDWDRERRRLGYSITIEAQPVRGTKRRFWR